MRNRPTHGWIGLHGPGLDDSPLNREIREPSIGIYMNRISKNTCAKSRGKNEPKPDVYITQIPDFTFTQHSTKHALNIQLYRNQVSVYS